jgi:DNA-binding transcriptional regulator YdaS (Cro superfamily)
MTAEEVRKKIEAAYKAMGSQRAWARKIGVSAPFLNRVIRGEKEPSGAILHELGLERIVDYQPVRRG